MKKFPFYMQETDYTCGAACMRMALEWFGMRKTEMQVAMLLGTVLPGGRGIVGTRNRNFPELAERLRLDYIVERNSSIKRLAELVERGWIVIVGYYIAQKMEGHYALARRIDSRFIHFWDPWFGPGHKYELREFLKLWKNDPKDDNERKWLFAVKKS